LNPITNRDETIFGYIVLNKKKDFILSIAKTQDEDLYVSPIEKYWGLKKTANFEELKHAADEVFLSAKNGAPCVSDIIYYFHKDKHKNLELSETLQPLVRKNQLRASISFPILRDLLLDGKFGKLLGKQYEDAKRELVQKDEENNRLLEIIKVKNEKLVSVQTEKEKSEERYKEEINRMIEENLKLQNSVKEKEEELAKIKKEMEAIEKKEESQNKIMKKGEDMTILLNDTKEIEVKPDNPPKQKGVMCRIMKPPVQVTEIKEIIIQNINKKLQNDGLALVEGTTGPLLAIAVNSSRMHSDINRDLPKEATGPIILFIIKFSHNGDETPYLVDLKDPRIIKVFFILVDSTFSKLVRGKTNTLSLTSVVEFLKTQGSDNEADILLSQVE